MENIVLCTFIEQVLIGSRYFGIKKMFNLDEEKIEYALGNKELCFWQGKKAENIVFCILYVRRAAFICLMYLTVQII